MIVLTLAIMKEYLLSIYCSWYGTNEFDGLMVLFYQSVPPSRDQFSCHVQSSPTQTKPRRSIAYVCCWSGFEISNARDGGLEGIEESTVATAFIFLNHLRHHGRFSITLKFVWPIQFGSNRLEGQPINPKQLQWPFGVIVFGSYESRFY